MSAPSLQKGPPLFGQGYSHDLFEIRSPRILFEPDLQEHLLISDQLDHSPWANDVLWVEDFFSTFLSSQLPALHH